MSITYASLATLQKFQQEVDSRYAKKFTLGLAKQATATSGYAATYKLTLDGVQVGDAINIPKDFLVKSATIEICETADTPVAGLAVGDKYTTNCVAYDSSEFADDSAFESALEALDSTPLWAGIDASGAHKVSATAPTAGPKIRVIKKTTMPDGTLGLKMQVYVD